VAVVAGVAAARALTGAPSASVLAATPDRLVAGKLWLLVTSALIVSGPALLEVAGLAGTVAVAVRRLPARTVVAVGPLCHVLATFTAYGMLLVVTGDPDGSRNHGLDYGISAVWLGLLGALFAQALPDARHGRGDARLIVAVAGISAVLGLILPGLLAATEHTAAFLLGALIVAIRPWPGSSGRPSA
jgi:hypothetical protein